jgi:catechol 2,3-dioxygenase-like lactoylglutathione lyase family enzyme
VFDHVTIRAADRAASERFYRTVLGAVGFAEPTGGDAYLEWDDFSVAPASAERPVTANVHVGFSVPSRAHVDAFWRAGTAAGYPDDGAPGPRGYSPTYYGAFLRDPDGNSVEAVHRDGGRSDGHVDHLWIRVADVGAARRLYEAVAPQAGIRVMLDTPDRVRFAREAPGGGSFSLVADGGPTTRHLHLAFPAPDEATVDAFHAAAVGAGFADNGAPGERPEYQPGYYGAFVLDADGNNVESVHHRGR